MKLIVHWKNQKLDDLVLSDITEDTVIRDMRVLHLSLASGQRVMVPIENALYIEEVADE